MSVKDFQYVFLIFLFTVGGLSSSCVFNVSKGGEDFVFDLSSLRSHEEEIKFNRNNNSNNEFFMHLSVCEPLQLSSSICMPGSLVCIVKRNLTGVHSYIRNAGSFYVKNKIIENDFYLELESNLPCWNRKNYSTGIQFRCAEKETSVNVLGYDETNCRFNAVWTSPYACPIAIPSALDSCLFKDEKNFVDFRKLRHQKYYTVQVGDALYEINICGAVVGGHCNGSATGCKISKGDNTTKVIGSYTHSKILKDKNGFKIIYPVETIQEDEANQMEIDLICYDSYSIRPELRTPKNKDKLKNRFVFSIGTPLACLPKKNEECWVVLSNDKYDASNVHSPDKNVEILGPFNTTFLLHVCGPLVQDSLWPGGDASAALVYNNGSILNIGRRLELSLVARNKALFVVYKGGDICPEEDKRLVTKIKLSCSETESGPVFLEYKNCTYIFEWKHPAVCPVKFAEGVGCRIKDPIYGREIILNPNPKEELVYEISARKIDSPYDFKINLCSKMQGKCNGNNDTSICLKKKNEEIVIGKRSTQVFRYISGGLFFTMTGDECKKGIFSKVQVEVVCDYSAQNNSKLKFLSEDKNCTFYFKWFTKNACPLRNVTKCSAIDVNRNFVDLTPLTLNNQNYKIRKGNATFLLNICGSLWYGKNQMCLPGSGACLLEDNEFHSLGEVRNPPNFNREGQLIIEYVNGRICKGQTLGAVHEQTTINFLCDTKDSKPEYVGFNHCKHLFMWKTTFACSKKDYKREDVGPGKSQSGHDSCRTYHPITKFPFNLHGLKGSTYSAVGEDNSKYKISACEDLLEKERCPNGSGICGVVNSKRISYGSANDRLFYDNKRLYLNYTDGDLCDGEKKHYTVIEFSCCFKNCPRGPVSVAANGKCEHFVRWPTKFACEMVECVAKGTNPPRTYDLSVLRRFKTNYRINMTGTPVFINVCKTLSPAPGLICPLEASSCIINGTKTYSFGNSHLEPVTENEKTVVLKYDYGSTCELDHSYNASSSYTFKCNRLAGVGLPVYEAVTDQCQYEFGWETSVVCPDTALNFDKSSCNLVNQETGKILNLEPAFKKGPIQVKSESKNFLVNLCLTAPTDKCNTALCSVQGSSYASYGEVQYTNFSYNYNTTTFALTEGARCDINSTTSLFYNTEIRLICTDNVEDAENGWTAEENGCKIIIEWRSLAACFTDKNAASGTYPHSLRAILAGVLSGFFILLFCAILFFRFAGNSISRLDFSGISLCRGSRRQSDSSGDVLYTRVGATEEATLRLGGKSPDEPNETDSDEELLRLV